ncbi:dUTPase [Clostridium botulinum]|nr:dUTPase [Clostridium botulinum]NFC90768.1 dUTPase [Clostridium botulinum]NFC99653.1 dUTPase [Clostridium botulinum]NFD38498.1 dUTPase [Clostridium botulinum]NFD42165.1 dUTPase [Clostridium botulinum]
MQLKEMFDMQKQLDTRIEKSHDRKLTFVDKIVAAIVELGEAANEIRWFKKWSNKGPSSKEVILEELIDGVHFILSIGNSIESNLIYLHDYTAKMELSDFSEDFVRIIDGLVSVKVSYQNKHKNLLDYLYVDLMENYLGFIYKLGFDMKDIEMMYYKKNEINHKRQDNNY